MSDEDYIVRRGKHGRSIILKERNVLRLDLKEGFFRRGRGRSFDAEGPKTARLTYLYWCGHAACAPVHVHACVCMCVCVCVALHMLFKSFSLYVIIISTGLLTEFMIILLLLLQKNHCSS